MAASVLLTASAALQAQADPAALRKVDVSLFAGVTAVYTGLSQGRDAAVTGGLKLNLSTVGLLRPSLESRFTTPVAHGTVDRQQSVLGGLRVEFPLARFHPYVDLLGGRGQIRFDGPYETYAGTPLFSQPASTVISPGAGVAVDLGARVSAFADLQLQHWTTPASLSDHLFSKPLTAGLSYRFALPHRHHASPE